MRPIYAFTCTIAGTSQDTLDALSLTTKRWITVKYERLLGREFSYPAEDQFFPKPDHHVQSRTQSGAFGEIRSFEIRHPSDTDASVIWNTLVLIDKSFRFCVIDDRLQSGLRKRLRNL